MILVEVVPAEISDLEAIAENMRECDREEAAAQCGLGARAAVILSVQISHEVWAGRVDGRAVCVFGIGAGCISSGVARPWMFGTDELERHAFAFLRRNRDVVRRWSEKYPTLENWVDARNAASIRWLRWLGFKFDNAMPFGAFGYNFHRFYMEQPQQCVSQR